MLRAIGQRYWRGVSDTVRQFCCGFRARPGRLCHIVFAKWYNMGEADETIDYSSVYGMRSGGVRVGAG